ncbi:bacteriocin immunity protein [Photobacterium kishitanii]|uniref:bacteriocin immunity protein n=1 Tax=Photobacterium kishitanii TaxID=318456 RepID=UPI0015E74D14|nr:bacteriocin immunity protein [Photobacterium kishitanii]
MKTCIQDYTESEFLAVIQNVHNGIATDQDVEDLVRFLNSTQYPEGSDLLMYCNMIGIEDTPEAMIEELKRWYKEQNLPLFKAE